MNYDWKYKQTNRYIYRLYIYKQTRLHTNKPLSETKVSIFQAVLHSKAIFRRSNSPPESFHQIHTLGKIDPKI